MSEFETLAGFLEHVSLVMERDSGASGDAVSIMTLHSAKGLEFDTIFLPGWEEGLFPHQRALDESGRAGLEEERRLAYVGLTRARKNIYISVAQNRLIHGLWQTALPSRFLDELPPQVVEVSDTGSSFGGYNYGGRNKASRFNDSDTFGSTYDTPGWKRARAQREKQNPHGELVEPRGPKTIDGELSAHPAKTNPASGFAVGQKVLHLKFGTGEILAVEGNKLTIMFETVGRKKVLESFVKREE